MSFDIERLYALLPAIYRIRDAEQGEPLKALLAVIAEQVAVTEENLAQLYDDQFIETCAGWVIPYIGDLIGYRGLYDINPAARAETGGTIDPLTAVHRAEVANTIGFRRRKGTVAMLEELARSTTNWSAHVVEFFQLLATTQYMKHLRPNNLYAPNLRRWEPLERLNSAFDSIAHTLDVRRIASGRGRYNIPNIGIFLWRLGAYGLSNSPAAQFSSDPYRYLFSPLGNNTPLFSRKQSLNEMSPLAVPTDVPMPISRRVLDSYLDSYYGDDSKSLLLNVNEHPVLPDPQQPSQKISDLIEVCNLSDLVDASNKVIGWAHVPQDKIAIDPVLGRIAFPPSKEAPTNVHVTFPYGFSADMGGGDYDRSSTLPLEQQTIGQVPTPNATIDDALQALSGDGVVLITDNGRYVGPKSISATKHIELRADNHQRPIVVPTDPTATAEIAISGDENAEVTLNGLLISGYTLRVTGNLSRLRLLHCTFVPGLTLSIDGTPQHSSVPSLIVEAVNVQVEIDSCIIGGLQVVSDNTHVQIANSIVDATAETLVAYSAPVDELAAGGPLHIENSTIIGKVHTSEMELASNTIFLASLAIGDTWLPLSAAVLSDRRQAGCVRFSYLPPASIVPHRYHCQPATDEDAVRMHPQFTSLRYGDPGYCQLCQRCAVEIRRGADDEAEMGAFHNLYQPQRETNLRVRLGEYLRFGLEAGIFYAS
ncbi:hypothetical protein [Ktedonobacter racemifer]|uniref:Uncharacterized protein n=1 Tax=Ktedonobacter racemifer DSM 44963 TaxID=485913 RepID=D6TXD4_KTERA|nr:hypothetical protein [Ktedonobacter racemifer]EFH84867.1 conserved hypothetical protein [Ktedonobacter racemifer DSM 44963]